MDFVLHILGREFAEGRWDGEERPIPEGLRRALQGSGIETCSAHWYSGLHGNLIVAVVLRLAQLPGQDSGSVASAEAWRVPEDIAANLKLARRNIRTFMLAHTPTELRKELDAALDYGQHFRAACVRELMAEADAVLI
jgi:hypothetical protein